MHPVNLLFEDLYRAYWSIATGAASQKRRGKASPSKRGLRFLMERKHD